MSGKRQTKEEKLEWVKIDPAGPGSRHTCCAVSNTCFRFLVGFLVLLALAAVIVILILAWNQTSATLAIERYCGTVPGSSPDDGSHLTYMITLDLNSRIAPVGWEFELTNTTDVVLTAGVYGPITPPSPVAPLFFALCGTPSSLACTPSGTIAQTNPGGAGLNGYITHLRAYPIGYYLEVTMALGTTYTSFFTQSCGRAAG